MDISTPLDQLSKIFLAIRERVLKGKKKTALSTLCNMAIKEKIIVVSRFYPKTKCFQQKLVTSV